MPPKSSEIYRHFLWNSLTTGASSKSPSRSSKAARASLPAPGFVESSDVQMFESLRSEAAFWLRFWSILFDNIAHLSLSILSPQHFWRLPLPFNLSKTCHFHGNTAKTEANRKEQYSARPGNSTFKFLACKPSSNVKCQEDGKNKGTCENDHQVLQQLKTQSPPFCTCEPANHDTYILHVWQGH